MAKKQTTSPQSKPPTTSVETHKALQEPEGKKAKKLTIQCCVPDCEEIAVTRGLCSKCYSAASNLVKGKGDTISAVSWASLEGLGLAKPSQRDPSPNKLLEALKAKETN